MELEGCISRFYFPPFFFLQWRATHWAFHHFIISPNIDSIIHCMILACHTIEVLLQGSCYLTNLFFFFFSWLKSLCWDLVLFEAAIITTTTPTYTSKLQNAKWVCFLLVMCHNMDHGLFSAGAQESQVHLIVLVPHLSPPANFIDLSLII